MELTKKCKIESIKSEVNNPKEKLMTYRNKLEEIGATKEANQLDKIIAKLEQWQNK